MKTLLYNGRVITPWRSLRDGFVLIDDASGKIEAVGTGAVGDIACDERIDVQGKYIAPGFIDIHTHGGGDHDFMDGTVEAILTASRAHFEHGTTSIFPSTVSATNESLFPVLDAYKEAKKTDHTGANLCGLHLEGPYFSMEQKGAMDPRYVRNPDMAEIEAVLARSEDIVRWSVAPELPGALEMGRYLRSLGILPSIGHTMAVYDEAIAAFESGFTLCTHLYSGMPGVRRIEAFRHAGPVETAFIIDDMDVEIIADGVHLPETLLKLIYQAKGPARIALITDSMRAAGQTEGTSILGDRENGLPVLIEDGVAKLPDRTAFAGSIATTDRLVRTMRDVAGVSIEDSVRMVTATPARIMGLTEKGRIAPSFDADLTVFDESIRMNRVYRGGKCLFEA
ncbi:MAG: N-acetylglucosamine-6-phosphate deacetylase [Ruminococcaceae bacterium]|nr:N-acetylglucosamine-6-phosphate deacetylase [Oscillospiraceae bacterium]